MKEFKSYQFYVLVGHGDIPTNITNQVSNDPLPQLKQLIRQFISDDHDTAIKFGIKCPEWNEETQVQILGASYDAVVKHMQRPLKQTICDSLFNGIVESFEIDHIMPKKLHLPPIYKDQRLLGHHEISSYVQSTIPPSVSK
jgi:hypothetical protein